MELREKAESILDCFLFEDVINNRIPDEYNWAITWEGEEFVLFHYPTEQTFNFRVSIEQGTLTEQDIRRLGEEQEWFEDE